MVMMGLYTLVIVGSTWLAAFIGGRIFARLARELGAPAERAQLAAMIGIVAFSTVISLPAGVLLAVVIATVWGYLQRSLAVAALRSLIPLAAILALALVGLAQSPGTWPASLPSWSLLPPGALVFFAALWMGERHAPLLLHFGSVTIFAGLPLVAAPLLFAQAHASLALDHAILGAGLLGAMAMVKPQQHAALLLRLPAGLLFGYNVMQTAHYGAWPLALAALLIWLAGIAATGREASAP